MRSRLSTIIIFLSVLGFNNCTDSTNSESDILETEALDFALEVIRSYIQEDTASYRSYLRDTLFTMESGDDPIPISTIFIIQAFGKFNYSDYTIDDFMESYSSEIIDFNSYKNQPWVTEIQSWHPDSEDYLYHASLKEGGNDFMWDDLLTFSNFQSFNDSPSSWVC